MKRRYAVAISAMIVALPMAEAASAAEPSIEQLEMIEDLLQRNDIEELRSYVAAHPELLEGFSPLSQLLAQFLAESANLISYLALRPIRIDHGSDDRAAANAAPDAEDLDPAVPIY